jgi:peptidoglycan/xylan/chitin deacetylase (PgdA/CDA1 family)
MFATLKNTIRNLLERKAVILLYHQISERKSDPWELAVSPEAFNNQLMFLKTNFDLVPLSEIANGVANKNLKSRKVAITFDDGFVDNYTNARPILEDHNVPATFYVATHATGTGNTFWWETLESLILHTEQLPRGLRLRIGNGLFDFTFYTDDVLTRRLRREIREWTADKPIPNERISLFFELWKRIQPLTYVDQQKVIANIKEWTRTEDAHVPTQLMTFDELSVLDKNDLFTIGAHTVHHAMLAEQDPRVQAFEVNESKKTIEHRLGKTVDGFAYPYGNYNSVTKKLLREAGFRHAVSTERRVVKASDDVYALPRIHVKNWQQEEFSANIQHLLSDES